MSLFIFMSYPSMIRHLNIKPYLLLLLLTLRLHATAQTPRELIATGLPLLEIVTDGLAVPTCEVVTAPVGCTGTSLSRNNGVSGCLCLTIGNRLAYASGSFVKGVSGMTIRRWGDSNGAFAKQHPYRLELESEADLLLRSDGDHSHKVWELQNVSEYNSAMSNSECNILMVLGAMVSRYFETGWVPAYELVNVMLNGEYQGMYYLVESVDEGKSRIDTGDTGFLIEHDTYWWNESLWFRTDLQPTSFAFTFPSREQVPNATVSAIRSYMDSVERAIDADSAIADYIDMESFAKWILVHDILGTNNNAGSSRFLYKADLDPLNPNSSKLKMGPPQKLSSALLSDSYSTLHNYGNFYFKKLFTDSLFCHTYDSLRNERYGVLAQYLRREFDTFLERYEQSFEQSAQYHRKLYPGEIANSLRSQVETILEAMEHRIDLIVNLAYHPQVVMDSLALPLLTIVTQDSVMPKADPIKAPEGCIGTSITNNDYVAGRMTMTLLGDTLYDSGEYVKSESGMRIKRRGNSSAMAPQHPYKLKLSKKADLLLRTDADYRNKNWVLLNISVWNEKMLNKESNLINALGAAVSHHLEQAWTPSYGFVNVVLNGQYQGMYYLMESVDEGKCRVKLDNSGFLIEHDTFWWNEAVWFRTERQSERYAFTYKYPDDDDVTQSYTDQLQHYMETVETAIYDDDRADDYLDMDSFAKWMLIHDVLGTDDSSGCNRFLSKYDFNPADYTTSKLCMGPVWDYDSAFRADSCSNLHIFGDFYFPRLFTYNSFLSAYISLWDKKKNTLMEHLRTELDSLLNRYETPFTESAVFHRFTFAGEIKNTLRSQANDILKKMERRLPVVQRMMDELSYMLLMPVSDVVADHPTTLKAIVGLDGRHHPAAAWHRLPAGVYVVVYSDGSAKKIVKCAVGRRSTAAQPENLPLTSQ